MLLGGATALLPVYARDILQLGPWALGVLRSAPAAGAAVTGVALALRPIERRAGITMFACVAIFGAATIVFGLSRSFALSLVALVVVGASDMVSVFVRSALVQLATPDAMRGRVSAVNMVFIGASNELGEFESGVTAQWLGPCRRSSSAASERSSSSRFGLGVSRPSPDRPHARRERPLRTVGRMPEGNGR